MSLRTLTGLTAPARLSPGPPPPCPRPRTPCQPPGDVSPCPSDATAGLVSSSPQPCPARPWAPPSWAHLQALVPAQPRPVLVPREVPDAHGWGCPWSPQPTLPPWDGPWLLGPALPPQGAAMARREPPAHAPSTGCEVVSFKFRRNVEELHWECSTVRPDTKLSSVNCWGIFVFLPWGQTQGFVHLLDADGLLHQVTMCSAGRSHSPTLPPETTPGFLWGRKIQVPIFMFLGLLR